MRRALPLLALLSLGCDDLLPKGFATAPRDLPRSKRAEAHDVGHVLWRGSALTGVGARFALHQGTAHVLLFTGAGYDEDLAPVEPEWRALQVDVETGEVTAGPVPPLPMQGPIALGLRVRMSPDGRTLAGIYDTEAGRHAVVARTGEAWTPVSLPEALDERSLRLGAGSILVPQADGTAASVGAVEVNLDPGALIPEWAAAQPRHFAAWDGRTARLVYGPDPRTLCTAAMDDRGLASPPRCVEFVSGHGGLVGAAVGTPEAAHFVLDLSVEYGPGAVGLYSAGPSGIEEVATSSDVAPVGEHHASGLLFAAPEGGEQLLVVGAGELTAVNTETRLYRRYPSPSCQCVGEASCACSNRQLQTIDFALDGPYRGALLGYDPVSDGRHAIMVWQKTNFPQHDPEAVGMGVGEGGDGRAVLTVSARLCDEAEGPVTEQVEALTEVTLPTDSPEPGRHLVDPNGRFELHLSGPADADPPWVPEVVEVGDLEAGVETPLGEFVLTRGWALGALYGDQTIPAATGQGAHLLSDDGWLALTWGDGAPRLTPLGPEFCVLLGGNTLALCPDGALIRIADGTRGAPDPELAGAVIQWTDRVFSVGGGVWRVEGDEVVQTVRAAGAIGEVRGVSADGGTALLWGDGGLEVVQGIDGPRFPLHAELPQQVMITDDGARAVVLHNTGGLGQLTAYNLEPMAQGQPPVFHRFSLPYERISGGAAMDPVTGRVVFANNRLPENGEPAVLVYDSMALSDDPEAGRPDPWEIELSQPMTFTGGGECAGGYCFVNDTGTLIVFDMAQAAEVARLTGSMRRPVTWRGLDRGPMYYHDLEQTWFEWAGDGFEPVWTEARGLAPVAFPSDITVHQERGTMTLQRGDADELLVRVPIDGSPAAAYDPRHLQPDWWAMPCALYRHVQQPASGALETWRCVR